MPKVPALIDRRALLGAAMASASCATVPKHSRVNRNQALSALPMQTASAVPFQPLAYEGQVVLLTFMATWCFPCLAELLVLERLGREHRAQGFRNILVGMDLEGVAVLAPLVAAYAIEDPVVVADDFIRSGESVFGRIREVPMRLLFGRTGELLGGYTGVIPFPDLERLVVAAL